MVTAERTLVIPTLTAELGLELPPDADQPDYTQLTRRELHDEFVGQFERIIPYQGEEPRPRTPQIIDKAIQMRQSRLDLHVDYALGSVFVSGIHPPKHTHRRERQLKIPMTILIEGCYNGDRERDGIKLPVTFTAGEFYGDGLDQRTEPWRGQSEPSIEYGKRGSSIGRANMDTDASKRAYGIGIEVLKIIDPDKVYSLI
jgi:hypothetical protein